MKHEISLKSTVTKGVICVTSTKLNPFGPAVSERYLPEFKKKRLVTSLALPLQYLFFVTLSHAMLFLAVKANYLKCKNVSSNEADPGISNSPVWARSGLLFPVLSLAENLGSGNFADSVVRHFGSSSAAQEYYCDYCDALAIPSQSRSLRLKRIRY